MRSMSIDLKRHIGTRLKQARKLKGLTQERLAEKVKKYPETISNIERGSVYVGLKLLEKLAQTLEVPMAFFFEDFGDYKGLSRSKIEATEKLKELGSKLSGSQFQLAVEMLETLVEHSGKSRKP
jgi:transcriptional regulator with XRE-family HTH domain